MRSLIVSDLHLGAPSGRDVLRRPEARRALLAELEQANELVLLGDVLELRGIPAHAALARAGPVLGDLGEAAGDARVTVVPGNHDHRLAAEWIERRRQRGTRRPLAPEESWRPGRSGLAARLARAMGTRELLLAYPGHRLRPDVWATHGHYLDLHNTVPAFEALAASAVKRLTGGLPEGRLAPDDYEEVLAPLYAFGYELAQSARPERRLAGSGGSMRVWQALRPHDGGPGLARLLLGGVLIPGAVAGVNRAGLGPFSRDLSPAAIRRAGLGAMAAAVDRMGIDAEHVIFGHTHRAGPLPGDDDRDGWGQPGGRQLWNSGSWVYEPALIGRRGVESGHWPGGCVVVEDRMPPRLVRLLDGGLQRRSHSSRP